MSFKIIVKSIDYQQWKCYQDWYTFEDRSRPSFLDFGLYLKDLADTIIDAQYLIGQGGYEITVTSEQDYLLFLLQQ